MTVKATICLLFTLCGFATAAQKISFRQMDTRQGLPASEVYNLHQDKKGYVWAFTEFGIVKHNGTRFVPVCKNLPLGETAVYKVAESPDGVMYIANSNAKIYRIAGDSAILLEGLEHVSAELVNNNKTILHLAADGTSVWFASHYKCYKYDLKKACIEPVCGHERKNEITFQTIAKNEMAPKCMHVASPHEKCLFRLTDSRNRVLFSFPVLYSAFSRNAFAMNEHGCYLMTANDVMLVGRTRVLRHRKFKRTTLNMQLAPNGHLWLGMGYDGLYEMDAQLNVLKHYLPGATVSDILFDNQGGLWVSTIGRGVFYCRNSRITSYDDLPDLSESITLLKVIRRQLFIGTASGKLFVYTDKKLHRVPAKENDIGINDVVAGKGCYIVGARSGIFMLDDHLKRVGTHLTRFGGYAFAEQKNKKLLVVSASDIWEKEVDSDEVVHRKRTQRPRCIAVRKDGTVFVSTRKGLFILEGKMLLRPDFLRLLEGKNISRLLCDDRQNIWVCTTGSGLYRLSPGNKLICYSGLPSSVIADICFIGNNAVLATNKGAFVTSLGKDRFGSWKQLIDKEVVTVADFGDRLYLGTKIGLIILEKEGLLDRSVYPFYLESVLAGRTKLSPAGMQLERYQNNLYFNFDFLAYPCVEKHLMYELEGPSPARGVINGTQIHLQNLAPGRYSLMVYPVDRLKNKRQKGLMTYFYIAPGWWETGIFRAAVILLSVLLIVLITGFVLLRLRRKAEARDKVTRLLAVYRLTALKAQINPHFISNSLSAIQELVITGQTDKANQYLARFSLLIRYLLNYSDQSVASLFDELKIIDLIIELEQLRFNNRFVFRKEIAGDIDTNELFIPPLITQPFIENAIWHGLLPLKGKRVPELVLSVVREQEQLTISIIDNGVGRNGRKAKSNDGHQSKGTGLIRHRIDNLNKLHKANGAFIRLTDLMDENGSPAGMRVDIIFPTEMLNTLYDEQDQEHYY